MFEKTSHQKPLWTHVRAQGNYIKNNELKNAVCQTHLLLTKIVYRVEASYIRIFIFLLLYTCSALLHAEVYTFFCIHSTA